MPLPMVKIELRELLDEIPEHLLQLVQHNDRDELIVKVYRNHEIYLYLLNTKYLVWFALQEVADMLLTMEEHLARGGLSKLKAEDSRFFQERRTTLRQLRAALA